MADDIESTVLARILRHDWSFPENGGGSNIFSLHPYPAKFIPQIPRALIQEIGVPKNTVVLDPFCGCGTSLIVAQENNIPSIGVDLNPIACLISRVATRCCPALLLEAAQDCVDKAKHNPPPFVQPDIPNLDHWFKPAVQKSLHDILFYISQVRPLHKREALQLALSSTIVRVSNQDSDTRYAAVEKNVTPHVVFSHFIRACSKYEQVLRPHNENAVPSSVINRDILDVSPEDIHSPVGLVVTSPPYPNAYEYWLYHKYRMWWLGYDPEAVREKEMGARPHFFKKNGMTAAAFGEQMTQVFSLLAKVCVPTARVCFVVGDSKIHGEIVDNTALLVDAGQNHGFHVEAVLPRTIAMARKSFNLAHARIKTENLVVMSRHQRKRKSSVVSLYWHNYRYFPYEKKFAMREIAALPGLVGYAANCDKVTVTLANPRPEALSRLVYYSRFEADDQSLCGRTLQYELENTGTQNGCKQSTRYGVHGLHEYKGKFNPQVVRGILNAFGLPEHAQVVDPFCGSGTALVESVIAGHAAYGWDRNPFAVFLSNAKLLALKADPDEVLSTAERLLKVGSRSRDLKSPTVERDVYLSKWFPSDTLAMLETFRSHLMKTGKGVRFILEAVLSDLLRDYSRQEPSDLRIRRRFSPYPDEPLTDAFEEAVRQTVESLRRMQSVVALPRAKASAFLADCRSFESVRSASPAVLSADAAVTSPPYATALPYIDTQRLSLVWLGLVSPKEIKHTEEVLIGSREASKDELGDLRLALSTNQSGLPHNAADLCKRLQARLRSQDGFRRQAVPGLLYRYFGDMQKAFSVVLRILKNGAPYALIVGTNRTCIGGETEVINTPQLLAEVAEAVGWRVMEVLPLEVYNRYGLHAGNAVQDESLVVLRK